VPLDVSMVGIKQANVRHEKASDEQQVTNGNEIDLHSNLSYT